MRRISRFYILISFILFLAASVFAQEGLEEKAVSDEEVMLTEELGEGVITGEVISLDKDLSTITVKIEDGIEKTFSVVGGETILWRGIEDIELADIKKGEEAEVGYYTDESGNLIASWVDVLIEEEIAPSVPLEELEAEKETEDIPQE